MRLVPLAPPFLLVLALSAGCGGNVIVDVASTSLCEATCPKIAAACPQQSQSCAETCATYALFEGPDACPDEIEAYFTCLDASPEYACNAGLGACAAAEDDLGTCIVDFCASSGGC